MQCGRISPSARRQRRGRYCRSRSSRPRDVRLVPGPVVELDRLYSSYAILPMTSIFGCQTRRLATTSRTRTGGVRRIVGGILKESHKYSCSDSSGCGASKLMLGWISRRAKLDSFAPRGACQVALGVDFDAEDALFDAGGD